MTTELNGDEKQLAASGAFDALRRFARKPKSSSERCEMCSAELAAEHPHLFEFSASRLHCACEPCAMLFSGTTNPKYKRVPRDIRLLTDFHITDAEWDGLLIPINLAFFFQKSSDSKVTVMYPSPAGATESLLPLEAWTSVVDANPILRNLEPDVEALLVNRVGYARSNASCEYYIAPIDVCYKLVGLIRLHWHGLSGGTEVWQQIAKFFTDLRNKSLRSKASSSEVQSVRVGSSPGNDSERSIHA